MGASGDNIDVSEHPYAFAWYSLAGKMSRAQMENGPKGSAVEEEVVEEKRTEEVDEEEDDEDLFGSDDDDDQDARMELKAKAHEAKFGKKVKAVVIAKSLVIFEVKPL